MNILKAGVDSFIGNIAKAYIEIEDQRVAEVTIKKDNDTGKFNVVNKASKVVGSFDKKNLVSGVASYIDSNKSEFKTNRYTVRFNPSELKFSTVGGDKIKKRSHDGSNKESSYSPVFNPIQLTVRLVFDDMTVEDCFMNELLEVKSVVKKGVKAITKNKNSVQRQVEGFIAAMKNNYTRRVTFGWGNMCYKGILNYMNAQYTMFSIEGTPVRAYVDIGILCIDENITKGVNGQWKNSFEKAFNAGNTNLESAGQKVGNLLNINL